MKVPDYRQESDWKKMGLKVSRQMLNYWDLKSSQYYFKPVYDLLKQKRKRLKTKYIEKAALF